MAVEFRSFSKTAGFTGTRCAYTVVPKACRAYTEAGKAISINTLWNRRHTTKFNSVSGPVQRAAEAVCCAEGKPGQELVGYYLHNARYIREQMEALGYDCIGGDNSPYIWIDGKGDSGTSSICCCKSRCGHTPGAGFGKMR